MKCYINKESKKNDYPCYSCNAGYGSYSNGKDEKGEFVEITSCKDDCYMYKIYKQNVGIG